MHPKSVEAVISQCFDIATQNEPPDRKVRLHPVIVQHVSNSPKPVGELYVFTASYSFVKPADLFESR